LGLNGKNFKAFYREVEIGGECGNSLCVDFGVLEIGMSS